MSRTWRRLLRLSAGAAGLLVGYLLWWRLESRFRLQVDDDVIEALQTSSAFGVMYGLAGVLTILGPSLVLAAAVDAAVTRRARTRRTPRAAVLPSRSRLERTR